MPAPAPGEPRAASASLLGWLAGAALPAFLQGLLQRPPAPAGWQGELLLTTFAGNLLAALLAGGLVLGLQGLRRRPAPGLGASFVAGLGLGLMPLAAAWMAPLRTPPPPEELGALAGLPLFLLAPRLGRCLPLDRLRAGLLLAALALLAPPLAFLLDRLDGSGEPAALGERWPKAAPAPETAPDLVLISVDTLRADALFGEGSARTPNLERLRAAGLSAPWARSSSNATLAGHAGMLSGQDAAGHGVTRNEDPLPADYDPFVRRLQAAGWKTAGVVTNGLLLGSSGFARGFDFYDDHAVRDHGRHQAFLLQVDPWTWFGWLTDRGMQEALLRHPFLWGAPPTGVRPGELRARAVVDQGLRILEEADRHPGPLFLFLHFLDPHTPYHPPREFRGRRAELEALPEPWRSRVLPRGRADNELLRELGRALKDPEREAGAREALAILHELYLEEVESLDAELGRLLEALEARQRPFVLLLTSDHGEHFGEHRTTLHANSLWEELIRVPFLLYGAGVPAGELPPPALMDVAPTLLARAGLPHEDLPGLDLLAPGAAEVLRERGHLALDHKRVAWVRRGLKWLGLWDGPGTEPRSFGAFDLERDPRETGDPPVDPAPLLEEARPWIERARPRQRGPVDATRRAVLEQLGYAEGG